MSGTMVAGGDRRAGPGRVLLAAAYLLLATAWVGLSGDLLVRLAPAVDGAVLALSRALAAAGIPAAGLLAVLALRERSLVRRRAAAAEAARCDARAHLRTVLDGSPLAIVAMDLDGTVTAWNPAAERLFGWSAQEVVGLLLPYLDDAGWAGTAARRAALLAGTAEPRLVRPFRRRDGTSVMCSLTTGVIRDAAGVPTGYISLLGDLTEELRREDWNAQLRRAIDQAGEAIVITDAAATITYVNPAFVEVTGYPADELLGRNPRILGSGRTAPEVYGEMWRRLRSGERWCGHLVNRRADGSLYDEEATISPVTGADGAIVAFVGVKRDTTRERELAAGLSSELRDRAAVRDAMARIEAGETPEVTGAGLCEALGAFPEIEEAIVLHLPAGGGPVVPVGSFAGPHGTVPVGQPLDAGISSYVREHAEAGPWATDDASRVDPRIDRPQLRGRAAVAAPIVHRGRPIGVLFAAAAPSSPAAWKDRHQRIVAELAAHVGPLLGPQLEARDAISSSRDEIQRIIDGLAFATVFQPVCELASRDPVGWEALTRFADGTPPGVRFADAHALGLGEALELACLRAALATFRERRVPGWLSLNVSPALVRSGAAGRVLADADLAVVLELTEHAPIEDYTRLRAAIEGLGPRGMIAVDDAGAGYASLRHVLELRPDLVKLDVGLVRTIDRDPARQAMVAGMVHYAAETGTRLVAEGIETEAERRCLLRLGVAHGQGYLLGVPSPSAVVAPRAGARRVRPRAGERAAGGVAVAGL